MIGSATEIAVVAPVSKIKMAVFAIIFTGTGIGLWVLQLPELMFNKGLVDSGAIAVRFSAWGPAVLLGSPMFFLLAYGFLLKIFDKDKGAQFQYVTNVAITFVFAAMIVRSLTGFVMDSYLEGRGYSKCIYYTSPANFSPQVWVRSPEYCIEQTGVVRRPLMEWLQSLPDGGNQVTPAEVRAKALEMLAAYEAGERFLD